MAKAKFDVEGTPVHEDVTLERVMELVEADDYQGLCIACGAEQDGCEPDARNYECESCGAPQVFGASELLMYMAF